MVGGSKARPGRARKGTRLRGPRLFPGQPGEAVVHLFLPDEPGVVAFLQIEVVGDVKTFQLVDELFGVTVVRLILGRGTQEDVEFLGGSGGRDGQNGAIGTAIFDAGTPDRALGAEVCTHSQYIAEDVGVVDSDVHGAEGAHRVARDGAVGGVRDGAIVGIDIVDEVEGDRIFE